MKFFATILIIVFCAFLSCKKDTKVSESGESPVSTPTPPSGPQPDSIFYHDVNPDTAIYSIRTYTTYQHWSGYCTKSLPDDSTSQMFLDVDGNSVPDVIFNASHTFTVTGSSCGQIWRQIGANSQNSSLTFFTETPTPFVKYFNAGDTIKVSGGTTSWCTFLVSSQGFYHQPYPIPVEKYLGIKKVINGKTYCGWVRFVLEQKNGIIIKEYAINKTDDNYILAGQTN